MTWRADAPQGFESDKVRFEVLPYLAKGGLDIGCGARKVWPHLIGLDNGKDTALFGMPMKPDIVINDAARLSLFADGVVESVFSSHTLEHIVDYRAALAEWWRVLKIGGYLVLYLPHRDYYPNIGMQGANPDHQHDFRPYDLIGAMMAIAPDWTLLENQERDGGNEYSFLQVYRKEAAGIGHHEPWRALRPDKTAAIVRLGGHGDALWASSACWHLKHQGYHVTAYVAHTGGEILKHDPNIDRLIVLPNSVLNDDDLIDYWGHEAAKYTKWVNLIGSVEDRLLAHPSDPTFYLAHKLRHKLMNRNYLEMVHDYADVPHVWRQRFYPSEDERAWARDTYAQLSGQVVVINPTGSGIVKTWPHTQRLMQRLAEAGIYSIVLGDLLHVELTDIEPYGIVVGKAWPVRHALAFALLADAVVGTESLIVNAVAFEPMLKIVLLSHSSRENLTRDWFNTASVEPDNVACYPCHRIHGAHTRFCSHDTRTGAAACLASATPDRIADMLLEELTNKERGAA